jgi:hypothetical protein
MPSFATGNETRHFNKPIHFRFIIPAKCYWRFVREFLPQSIQESLALEWNAHTERALSLSWLKNALNQQSLYFQIGFMIILTNCVILHAGVYFSTQNNGKLLR